MESVGYIVDEKGDAMNNVAILTYHSAYNFGSVLQAYASVRKPTKLFLHVIWT